MCLFLEHCFRNSRLEATRSLVILHLSSDCAEVSDIKEAGGQQKKLAKGLGEWRIIRFHLAA
jgi:hypothetical protein